ncbi:uncharacterized protein LTR77_001974 [Saxophila tyrrhenica]|uniref:Mei2-like C-terminal RNA recognition motif domain-containing protein n=1 Tax=Saxophila tyrrhenica TaxID=1690608 RepID=A0AAV9PKT2_9PEZI|nr:hypothetical protein LTR77_001974 [Saxophila tyrrhenica]
MLDLMDPMFLVKFGSYPTKTHTPTVSRERIFEGHDMLAIFNHANRRRLNFSYLRMGFRRGTNVGYDFVSFDDPNEDASACLPGHGWTRLAESTYGVCQGQDGCIEKRPDRRD